MIASLPGESGVLALELMKSAFLLSAAALMLSGCIYEAPLVAENKLPIDPAIVGLWEPVSEEGKEPERNGDNPLKKILEKSPEDSRLLILQFSEKEYMISESNNIHYRAYSIELGGKRCVQLQVISTNGGPMDWKDEKPRPFLVCFFEIKNGELAVHTLNEGLVSGDLRTTAELQEAFLKNKDNPELFEKPTIYRMVKAD